MPVEYNVNSDLDLYVRKPPLPKLSMPTKHRFVQYPSKEKLRRYGFLQ